MHVTDHWQAPDEGTNCVELRISEEELARLTEKSGLPPAFHRYPTRDSDLGVGFKSLRDHALLQKAANDQLSISRVHVGCSIPMTIDAASTSLFDS